MKCPNCKSKILDDSEICVYCYCDIAKIKEQNELLEKEKIENKEKRKIKKNDKPTRGKTFGLLVLSLFLFTTGLNFLAIIFILMANRNAEYIREISNGLIIFLYILFGVISLGCLIGGIFPLIKYIMNSKKYFTGELTLERKKQLVEQMKAQEEKYEKIEEKKRYKCNACERILPEGTKKCIYCGNTVNVNDYFDINSNMGDMKVETEMSKVDPEAAENEAIFVPGYHSHVLWWDELSDKELARHFKLYREGRVLQVALFYIIYAIYLALATLFMLFGVPILTIKFIGLSFLIASSVFILSLIILFSLYCDYKILKE